MGHVARILRRGLLRDEERRDVEPTHIVDLAVEHAQSLLLLCRVQCSECNKPWEGVSW